MTYEIIGTYQGERETVDTAEDREEAETLLSEYQLAFGPGWNLRIKEDRPTRYEDTERPLF